MEFTEQKTVIIDFKQDLYLVRSPPGDDGTPQKLNVFLTATEAGNHATECLAPRVLEVKQDLAETFLQSLEHTKLQVFEEGEILECSLADVYKRVKKNMTVVLTWKIGEDEPAYLTISWKELNLIRSYLGHQKIEEDDAAPRKRKRSHDDEEEDKDDDAAHSPELLAKVIHRFAQTSVLDSLATEAVRSEIGSDYGVVMNAKELHISRDGVSKLRVVTKD